MPINKQIAVANGEALADVVIKNGRVIDVFSGRLVSADVAICAEKIVGLGRYEGATEIEASGYYIAPGFIDAHVHIESAMTSVTEFSRTVLRCGTTTVVADPHEIANVHGTAGLDYMLASADGQPVNIYYTLPSCVPATDIETAGARLTAEDLVPYFGHERVIALAEMMNFPGVIARDEGVMAKLKIAQLHGKTIDGHAPGLSGKALNAYCAAGIRSDHECTTTEEAMEKLTRGMVIMIRQGSVARDLKALAGMVNPMTSSRLMWCTDDRHPHDLLEEGHIDAVIRDGIAAGIAPITAIRMATLNPALHFNLRHLGAVAPGYQADLVLFRNLGNPHAEKVFFRGRLVSQQKQIEPQVKKPRTIDPIPSMNVKKEALRFSVKPQAGKIRVIELTDNQLITGQGYHLPKIFSHNVVSDIERDLLKIAVVERHHQTGCIGLGFVQGFNLKKGALASSVGHDSHNIIAVGASDDDMAFAVKAVVEAGGGMVAVHGEQVLADLALPIAGLMSMLPMEDVAAKVNDLLKAATTLGCQLNDPFMTLSFLALPVIPELKITDQGLFDLARFSVVPLFESA